MKYRLRTLLMLMVIMPPMRAGAYWAYEELRMSMVYVEMSPNGDALQAIQCPTGRVLAEYPAWHVNRDDDRYGAAR